MAGAICTPAGSRHRRHRRCRRQRAGRGRRALRDSAWSGTSRASSPTLASGTLSGGPMDALVLRIHFDLGGFRCSRSAPTSPWAAKAAESWLVSALLAAGHTERPSRSTTAGRPGGHPTRACGCSALLGTADDDRDRGPRRGGAAAAEGRSRIEATGSLVVRELQPAAGGRVRAAGCTTTRPRLGRFSSQLATHPVASTYAFLSEQRDMLTGSSCCTRARTRRRRPTCVGRAGMQRGERLLFLSTAATYLSEAEWRSG